MARHLVVPVGNENATIWTVLRRETAEPAVGTGEEVGLALAAVAGAVAGERFATQLVHVHVGEEEIITPLRRERAAQIEHRAAVAGLLVTAPGDRLDVLVNMRVEMRSGLARVVSALDGMPHVGDDAGGEKGLAVVVPIEPPLVAHALAPALEGFSNRVIAPDAGVDRNPFRIRCAGAADLGVGENSMRPIKPAVRSPGEIIQRLVGILRAPAIENDLRLAVGHRVAILVRNEKQIRRSA